MFKIDIDQISNGGFKMGPVKLNIEKGVFYHLIGKNGSGKSTLLNYIFRYYRDNVSNSIVYCPDTYIGYTNVTINEIEKIYKLSTEKWDYQEYKILYESLLDIKKNKYISTLSTGEKTKLLICILMAFKPQFIIFDEALYSLDIDSKEKILNYLKLYLEKNNAYFIGVSHDTELNQYSDQIIDIKEVVAHD
ncbi:ATP-binding cassette domain-containing protein [Mycoplasma sp. P36-A1]|uniref:ATP-binding cassette domain-containing protein n=1 Tax=Mycoplasma sp. P36-A1 TaxID=3252900 RepID=UPI003C2DDD84